MQVSATVSINAPVDEVWRIICDIDNAPTRISVIEEVDVLERPAEGIVGLKWTETRTMFGKTATETMWVTDAVENDYYDTEARSHGSLYQSRLYVKAIDGGTELGMSFRGEPLTFGARVMYVLMGFMFKGATEKAIQQDLDDLKKAAESGADA